MVAEQAVPFDGPVFFGGVPDDLVSVVTSATSATSSFFGCLGDATLNGQVVNFAQAEEAVGAQLQKCSLLRASSVIFERERG